jgi:outer membrane biosynthesis protein TonB
MTWLTHLGQLQHRAEPGDRQWPALDVDLRPEAGFPVSSSRKTTTLRQTLSRGVFVAAAATGLLSLYGNPALADTDTTPVAKDLPGLLSGNTVKVPIEVPVNLCGNTVTTIAEIGRVFGNSCVKGHHSDGDGKGGGYGYGKEDDTPPPPRASHTPPSKPTPPPARASEKPRHTPPPKQSGHKPPKPAVEQPGKPPQLAETGGKELLAASTVSAAMIAGGVMLYRRSRAASYR